MLHNILKYMIFQKCQKVLLWKPNWTRYYMLIFYRLADYSQDTSRNAVAHYSGQVLDFMSKGLVFKTLGRQCVVSISKTSSSA